MTPKALSIYRTLPDVCSMALTADGEAEDQGHNGMQAVCEVIRNRHDLWHQTYQQVCFTAGQFECFDKEEAKMIAGAEAFLNGQIGTYLAIAKLIAQEVMSGEYTALVPKCTFYKRFDAPSPWFDKELAEGKMIRVTQVAAHVFYAETRFL